MAYHDNWGVAKLKLNIKVANLEFSMSEAADPDRLEEWRAFADGKIDEIDYACEGGLSGYDIKVKNDSASVSYDYYSEVDFSSFTTVPASLLREQIRSQLDLFLAEN